MEERLLVLLDVACELCPTHRASRDVRSTSVGVWDCVGVRRDAMTVRSMWDRTGHQKTVMV